MVLEKKFQRLSANVGYTRERLSGECRAGQVS